MRAILFLIGGVVLGNIVWATFFFVAPPKAKAPEPIVNAATVKGQEPWMANEHHMVTGRFGQRKSALEALSQPSSSFCTAEGRKRLVSGLEYYWYFRSSQIKGYPKTWGENARPYIVKAWATADDNRIERLTREAYGNGYIDLADYKSYIREAMAETLRGERVRGAPCASSAALQSRYDCINDRA